MSRPCSDILQGIQKKTLKSKKIKYENKTEDNVKYRHDRSRSQQDLQRQRKIIAKIAVQNIYATFSKIKISFKSIIFLLIYNIFMHKTLVSLFLALSLFYQSSSELIDEFQKPVFSAQDQQTLRRFQQPITQDLQQPEGPQKVEIDLHNYYEEFHTKYPLTIPTFEVLERIYQKSTFLSIGTIEQIQKKLRVYFDYKEQTKRQELEQQAKKEQEERKKNQTQKSLRTDQFLLGETENGQSN